jgi:membrane-associated phospholipid phosphatase
MSRPIAWSASFALTVILVTLSYQWFDRPIAFFSHREFHGTRVFPWLTYIPEWLTPIAALIFVALGVRALTGRALSRFEAVIFLAGISLGVAVAIKDQLKFAFGRTWPESWLHNNPSLIDNGVYGFSPFHGGASYSSFPSGHTTAVCAVMSVLWLCYPRFRVVYGLVVAAVIIGLLGADYHFLSDVIAGAFLGASIGWFLVLIWEAGGARPVRPSSPRLRPKTVSAVPPPPSRHSTQTPTQA